MGMIGSLRLFEQSLAFELLELQVQQPAELLILSTLAAAFR